MLPGPDGAPAFIQGVMLDITERKRAEDRLAYLAYHDHITDLANKAKFDELLELAVARARRAGDRASRCSRSTWTTSSS